MYYEFAGERAKRRKKLRQEKKWNCFYHSHRLKDILVEADMSRPKEEFDLPTRYYNQYDKMIEEILKKKDYDNEMPFSHAECKFIIYLLVAYISDIRGLYDQIEQVFEVIENRRLLKKYTKNEEED